MYRLEISAGIPLGKKSGLGCNVAIIPGSLTTLVLMSKSLESKTDHNSNETKKSDFIQYVNIKIIVQIMFYSFGIIEPILVILKLEYRLSLC